MTSDIDIYRSAKLLIEGTEKKCLPYPLQMSAFDPKRTLVGGLLEVDPDVVARLDRVGHQVQERKRRRVQLAEHEGVPGATLKPSPSAR